MRLPSGSSAAILLCVSIALCFGPRAVAQIVTDGSLTGGKPQSLVGPNFRIGADLGRKVGGNLFHSFQDFNLGAGESALFTAQPGSGIRNVLARVTGPNASIIDGRIACDIPNANLLLANPNGVIFGLGAQLDVKGSFAVSTANVIHLADGGQFQTRSGNDRLLSSAPPSAFGFLAGGATPAPITSTGALNQGKLVANAPNLAVPQGKVLSIIGGQVQITSSTLAAPGGRVNVVSVASPGQVKVDSANPNATIDTASFHTLGDLSFSDGTVVSVTADRAGGVVMRSGTGSFQQSSIQSGTKDGNGGSIDIGVRDNLTFSGKGFAILTVSTGAGKGSDIFLSSGSTTVTGGAIIGTNNQSSGAGGSLHLRTGPLQIDNFGAIVLQCAGTGHGGSITVSASRISLNGGGASDPTPTGIVIETPTNLAASSMTGPLGDITINTGVLQISNLARISNTTRAQGHGGNITVNARHILLDAPVPDPSISDVFTGILAQSDFISDVTDLAGAGGNVLLRTRDLQVTGTAGVASNTLTGAAGGTVTVLAENGAVLLDGRSVGDTALGLDTATGPGSSGRGGSIVVRAGSLTIRNDGVVRTDKFGSGPAGTVDVAAHTILIDGGNPQNTTTTGIGAAVESGAAGPGGNVIVRAGRLTVMNGGRITSESASTDASANGGSVNVSANSIFLLSGGFITAETLLPKDGGAANGGDITVTAGQTIFMDNGRITTQAAKNGGNIHITAPLTITLQNASQIRTDATNGNGGSITIDPLILTLNNSTINANGGINGGNVRINADAKPGVNKASVTATGQRGVSGIITNNPANTDIARAITRLPESLLSVEARLQPQCAQIGNFSSFLVTGKGGLSLNPEFWQQPADMDRRDQHGDQHRDGK
jgi:filamentous hemagglutinin family protein